MDARYTNMVTPFYLHASEHRVPNLSSIDRLQSYRDDPPSQGDIVQCTHPRYFRNQSFGMDAIATGRPATMSHRSHGYAEAPVAFQVDRSETNPVHHSELPYLFQI